jgi:integrase
MADKSNTAKKKSKQKSGKTERVQKPYKDFPLTPHRATNRWCKKKKHSEKGNVFYYFGPLDDWQGALAKYEHDWPYIVQEIDPPETAEDDSLSSQAIDLSSSGNVDIGVACYKFLELKKSALKSGEITSRSYKDYHETCRRITAAFGKRKLVVSLTPDDFLKFRTSISEVRRPVAIGNEIQRVRMVFKFCLDNDLIVSPVRFGQGFKKPSKRVLRLKRQKRDAIHGKRMFKATELRHILNALDGKVLENGEPTGESEKIPADPVMKAAVLAGANCGFGQSDIANLPKTALDFESGWVDYPRPNTGVERRCPLWPETAEALKVAIQVRPKAKNPDDENMVFLTKYENRWVRTSENEDPSKRSAIDSISRQFGKLLKKLNIDGQRNFYCLRRGFETVAGGSLDQVVVNYVMGHIDNSMAAIYRQEISNERLQAATDHVHRWLWPPGVAEPDNLI